MNKFLKQAALGGVIALALAACGGSTSITSSPSSAPAEAIEVTLSDFKITPSSLTSGSAVSIAVTSDGPTPHNLTIRDAADAVVAATADLSTGGTETIEADLDAGEYTIFCSLAGHESLGMRGTLTVAAQ